MFFLFVEREAHPPSLETATLPRSTLTPYLERYCVRTSLDVFKIYRARFPKNVERRFWILSLDVFQLPPSTAAARLGQGAVPTKSCRRKALAHSARSRREIGINKYLEVVKMIRNRYSGWGIDILGLFPCCDPIALRKEPCAGWMYLHSSIERNTGNFP